ncbi:MAG: hypothetical protein Q9168_004467 [Polycauliona sp. 1 TL-2023]
MRTPFGDVPRSFTTYAGVQPDIQKAMCKLDTTLLKIDVSAVAADVDCGICSTTLVAAHNEEQEPIIGLPTCVHRFHRDCIMGWMNPIAPPCEKGELDSTALLFEKQADRAHILHAHPQPTETDHSHNQELVTIDPLGPGNRLSHPTPGDLAAAKTKCPMCRKPVFAFRIKHMDSLELVQLRLRLANLAYLLNGFQRPNKEQTDRAAVQQFLTRRWAEVTAGKQQSAWAYVPAWVDCVRLFKLARLILRDQARRYMQYFHLEAPHLIRVCQLIGFYENVQLRPGNLIAFFQPNPDLNEDWNFNLTMEKFHRLTTDPASFCSFIRVVVAPGLNYLGSKSEAATVEIDIDGTAPDFVIKGRAGGSTAAAVSKTSAEGDTEMPDAP